jgi:hypothetical protein
MLIGNRLVATSLVVAAQIDDRDGGLFGLNQSTCPAVMGPFGMACRFSSGIINQRVGPCPVHSCLFGACILVELVAQTCYDIRRDRLGTDGRQVAEH